jgi:hypothetical protein
LIITVVHYSRGTTVTALKPEDTIANEPLVGVKIASTFVIPRRDGFQLQVAADVIVALIALQPGIGLPSCKKSTVPAVPTPTIKLLEP